MKNSFVLLLMLILMLMLHQYAFSQSIVNKEWEIGFGIPDTIDIAATTIDNSGRIYTAGNTIISGQNANILTTRYDIDGNIFWQQTYNYSGGSKDYGTCITTDNNGFIYVAGASYINLNHLTDFTILKYDTTGNLIWSVNFNGGSYKIDIPSAITVDNSGNVYITGASAGYLTNEDYLTIKLDNNGNVLWNKPYNYAGFNDRPIGVVLDDQDDIIVTGYSELSTNSSEITTIKYDNLNGSQLFVYRYPQITNGINRPESIKKDNLNNIIVSGYEKHSTEGYNIKTIKFDNNLNVIWSKTHDETGNNDKAYSLDIDNQNNIIVCGYSSNQNSTKDIIIIKYDSNGNELWNKKRTTVDQLGNGEAKKIKCDNIGNSILLCSKTENNTDNILTIKYDASGNKLWEKEIDITNNDVINDLAVDQAGDVYLSTKQDNNYNSIKYSSYDKPMDPFLDSLGNPLYIKGEIIVRFDSSVVKKQAIDKIDLQYGNLNTFLEDTAILAMKTVLPSDIVDKMVLIKIFSTMTTNDTTYKNKSGDIIKIPNFWAAFRLTTVRDGSEIQFADTLNSLFPIVHYSHLNYVGTYHTVPDDMHYSIQKSLRPDVPGATPVNHINIEGAWDLSVGSNSVKVGVFDTGIFWAHSDFSWDNSNTYAGSVIKGGYEYTATGKSSDPNDFYNSSSNHGTHSASIIGAISNNGKNIAGIAGGNKTDNIQGVELYILRSSDAIYYTMAEAIYDAIVEFDVDLINLSAGFEYIDNPLMLDQIGLIKEEVAFAFESEVMLVASRGNFQESSSYTDFYHKIYPSCYPDEMVCSVGATNELGEWHNNFDDPNTLDPNRFTSMIGSDIDIMAPGVTPMITCLHNTMADFSDSFFNGTSASAPHISGISALMISYYNENYSLPDYIAPEDIEIIMQRNALDINTSGYDDYTGYGLADATKTLKGIKKYDYKIEHVVVPNNLSVIINSNYQIDVVNNLFNIYNHPVESGNYQAEVYEISGEIDNTNYSFNSGNYNVLDAWPLLSKTKGLYFSNSFENFDNKSLIDNSDLDNKSVLTTYCYHLTYNNTTANPVDLWIPCNLNDIQLIASIYLQNPFLSIEKESIDNLINIYPNPAFNRINVIVNRDINYDYKIKIYNINGVLVKEQTENSNNIKIDLENLENSLYIIKISGDDFIFTKRFIKL